MAQDTGYELLLQDKQTLETILDSLPIGIMAHDINRKILFFNKAAQEITGYSKEEVLGRDCHQVFGSPFCGGNCSFLDGPQSTINEPSYEISYLSRNGVPKRLKMDLFPLIDPLGELKGVLASITDLTHLLEAEIALNRLDQFHGIVGKDPKMLALYKRIREIGVVDYPVHIYGETGTGKELIALAVHSESRRNGGPFVPVNCAALPETLLESELFGHERGAFTGAHRAKKGRFELANRGTLFLDEVGDMPKALQAKLLRAVETGFIERLGGEGLTPVDVRIITATNKDLKKEVQKGNFREDLYYRLVVIPLHIPPLRKRKGDIPLLVQHFQGSLQREGLEAKAVSPQALEALLHYPWPGNVRELQSAIRYAHLHSTGPKIELNDLPSSIVSYYHKTSHSSLTKEVLENAIKVAGGNKAKAARLLGIGRATLYRYLEQYKDVS